MVRQVRIRFERGGEIVVPLLEQAAPRTCDHVWHELPMTAEALHTRWCGREVNWEVSPQPAPPKENQAITVCTGALVYWREWGEITDRAALGLYYGSEFLRDHRGFLPVNVFGQADTKDWPLLTQIGERIWREGMESVFLSRVEE